MRRNCRQLRSRMSIRRLRDLSYRNNRRRMLRNIINKWNLRIRQWNMLGMGWSRNTRRKNHRYELFTKEEIKFTIG